MPKTAEDQALEDAIAGTEREIFSEATGKAQNDADETGSTDRSLEEMGEGLEGRHVPVTADDDEAAEDATDGDDAADGDEDASDDADDDAGEGEQPRDKKTGQFKSKEAEEAAGKAKAKGEGEQGDPKAKPAGDGKAAEQTGDDANRGRVPAGRHREETQARRAAEQRASDAEAARDRAVAESQETRQQFLALNQRLDDLLAGRVQLPQPQQQQHQAKAPPPPDKFADPDGYDQWVQDRITEARQAGAADVNRRFLEASLADAHDEHGKDFETAYSTLTQLDRNDPAARVTVQKIMNAPNPGKALMRWHKDQVAIKEVGGDVAGFKTRIAAETREALKKDPEFRKQLLEELRAEASGEDTGEPARTVTRLPRSLNQARGGGAGQLPDRRLMDGSDAAIFEDLWKNPAA